jgi:hypothetical protein
LRSNPKLRDLIPRPMLHRPWKYWLKLEAGDPKDMWKDVIRFAVAGSYTFGNHVHASHTETEATPNEVARNRAFHFRKISPLHPIQLC